jgi:hypothetical protein
MKRFLTLLACPAFRLKPQLEAGYEAGAPPKPFWSETIPSLHAMTYEAASERNAEAFSHRTP